MALLAIIGGLVIVLTVLTRSVPVTVIVDDSAYQTTTQAATVADVLAEMGIAVAEGDLISPELNAPVETELIVQVRRARSVTLTIDDQSRTLRTTLTNPADILNSVELAVGPQDRLFVDGTETKVSSLTTWPVPVSNITIQRAVSLTINDEGKITTVITTGETVGDALFEAGVTLYLADLVMPDLNTTVEPDMKVNITRSRPVSIIADGVKIETRVRGATVGDALAEAGVALVGLDYAIPDDQSTLLPGISVRVIRVAEEVIVEQTSLPFETVYQADSNLELDQRSITQAGQNGVEQQYIRVRQENGVEITREIERTEITQPPLNQIINYGTNIVLRTIETPDGPRQYWRRLRMYATSYHPAALGGDNVTATGQLLTKGIISSDPDVIPYGTQVYVPDYGIGLMADTGGPRTRLWIDLGYDDSNFVSWSRNVEVYLLAPVPAEIDYLLPQSGG